MSDDQEAASVADLSDPGPSVSDEQNSAGDSDTGVIERGPVSSEEDGTSSSARKPEPEKSQTEDDDAFTKALMAGSLDDLDDNGDVKEKPKTDVADDPKGDKKPEEAAKPGPDDLTTEEKELLSKAPSKKVGKELDTLFKERRELRKQIEESKKQIEQDLRPAKQFSDAVIEHATSAGLVARQDGKTDFSGLHTLIETEKTLRGLEPVQVAKYYRDLAEQISPQPKPVELPTDLADLVELERLTKSEAEAIAERREAAKNPPKPPIQQNKQAPQKPTQPVQNTAKSDAGMKDIEKISSAFQKRFPSEWKEIANEVMPILEKKLTMSDPAMWGDLAQTEIDLAVAKRRSAPKKPPMTPRPTNAPPKRGDQVMSEEDELDALMHGRL